jgi:hypothetical protein
MLPSTPGEAVRHLMEMTAHAVTEPTHVRTTPPRLIADGA